MQTELRTLVKECSQAQYFVNSNAHRVLAANRKDLGQIGPRLGQHEIDTGEMDNYEMDTSEDDADAQVGGMQCGCLGRGS